jgi:hypothetical protein
MVRRRAVDHGSAVRGGLWESGVARGGGRPHRRERETGAGVLELQQGEPATRVEAGPSLRGCPRPAQLARRCCEAALLHWQPLPFLLDRQRIPCGRPAQARLRPVLALLGRPPGSYATVIQKRHREGIRWCWLIGVGSRGACAWLVLQRRGRKE